MSKISLLPTKAPEAITGAERVLINDGPAGAERAKTASIGALVAAAAKPSLDQAAAERELARQYANRDTDTDVPGGPPGSRGAKWFLSVISGIAAAINAKLATISDRSGYVGGWQAPNGLLGLGFRSTDLRPIFGNGGDVVGRVETLEGSVTANLSGIQAAGQALTLITAPRSGVLVGAMLPNGQMPWFIDSYQGRYFANGRYVAGELEALAAAIAAGTGGASSIPDFPTTDIAAWGDSLTDGGSSGDWPTKLAALQGVSVYNGGTGGQGSRAIAARQGGCPALLGAAVNIPATATPIVVTIMGGFLPINQNRPVLFDIAGVRGSLNRDTSNVLTFTRSAAGTAVAAPIRTPLIPVDGAAYRGRTMLVAIGRNNVKASSSDPQAPAEVVSSIRACLDFQNSRVRRAIVLGILPWSDETIGSAARTRLDSYNNAIAAAFPGEYLDWGAWLRTTAPTTIGGYVVNDPFTATGTTPTAQDLADSANGITPQAFRSDDVHLTQLGGTAVAYRIDMQTKIKGLR